MYGAVTCQKHWMVRPTAMATARLFVAPMPIGHKSGVSRPTA